MQYWILLIGLFEPLTRLDLTKARASLGNLLTYDDQIVAQANHCLEMLLRLYYARHGFEHCDTSLVHALHLVGFRALRCYHNERHDIETSRAALSTLILCAKGLHDQGQSYFLAEAVYRKLRARMNAQRPETVARPDDSANIEDEDERDELVVKHISSVWPVAAASPAGDTSKRMFEDVFRDVSRMELIESSDGSGYDHYSGEDESS